MTIRILCKQFPVVATAMALFLAGCNRKETSTLGDAAATISSARNSESAPASVPLVDRAASLGIEFMYRNGSEAGRSAILESLGGGLGWLDFDRDGWPDLAATGGGAFVSDHELGGSPGALFRNLDGNKFVAVGGLAGLESSSLYTHGVAIADYDNDGFQDILMTGYGRPQLWHNMGDGCFQERAAAAGVNDERWSSSAGWADFDGDGNLDLYLTHYVNWSFENDPYCAGNKPGQREICPPRDYEPLPDALLISQGNGEFIDGSDTAGLRKDGKGLGVLLCDMEPDGDVDIYVANDTVDNFLYLNEGGGRFTETGIESGVARSERGLPDGSMGVAQCDFNRDGRPDIWVANYERETFALYRNEGHNHFLHVSQRFGITDLGGLFVGFGTACEDFDSDGDVDMVVADGHVIKFSENAPRKQLPLLLQFDGRRFQRAVAAPGNYFGDAHEGRGLALADFDADGDLDVAISNLNEPLALLENQFPDPGSGLRLRLIGVKSNRDAVGARVELRTNAGSWTRQITGADSYLSHNDLDMHFALPKDIQPDRLVVHWPSGQTHTIDDASLLGGRATLVEGGADEMSPRWFAREALP